MPSEAETRASALLKADLQEDKLSCYEQMRHLSRASAQDLHNSGYRNMTQAEAVLMVLRTTMDKIEKKIRKFEKDFP
jgi:hypothetical protein